MNHILIAMAIVAAVTLLLLTRKPKQLKSNESWDDRVKRLNDKYFPEEEDEH